MIYNIYCTKDELGNILTNPQDISHIVHRTQQTSFQRQTLSMTTPIIAHMPHGITLGTAQMASSLKEEAAQIITQHPNLPQRSMT